MYDDKLASHLIIDSLSGRDLKIKTMFRILCTLRSVLRGHFPVFLVDYHLQSKNLQLLRRQVRKPD